ncbi:hypothetical protein EST38_g4710 [Candolleomyces aberdarensis]|uniref:Uncharacterized protein n=1 Tax=Candolleomyces aberdarensis TaxID=2316362 RepID=A0A4Q2DMG0_9AGAR|nr:hypothetical protein EST38_g4710 [Candolleomyces aberdarensis]
MLLLTSRLSSRGGFDWARYDISNAGDKCDNGKKRVQVFDHGFDWMAARIPGTGQ